MHASPPTPAAPSEQSGSASEQPASAPEQPASTPDVAAPTRPGPRSTLLAGGMLATSLLLAGLVVLPAPYAVQMPGPTADVLGEQNGTPLITIKGATTYPTTGQLRLTTVSATGTPGYPSSVANVVRGWLSGSDLVVPTEQLVPAGQTQQQINDLNNQEMTSSQENATVAALTELGYTVPATLRVAGTTGGTDAAGKLKDGDVLTAIDGTTLGDYQTLVSTLGKVKPGATITLGITRGGTAMDVPVVTGTRSDGNGALIGVFIDPTFTFPIDVKIQIDGIGGPSAGMMFALGIVDQLTPADETNGQRIAGTGTMDVTGTVGAIGGIRQKMAGALRDGATWFLAPKANCGDVVGHVPAGLHVVAVATLQQGVDAMTAIGKGAGSGLPTCG